MKLSSQIKPISYLKAHASEIVSRLSENEDVLVITRNGEAKAVIQSIESFEKNRETLSLLKILAIGNTQIESGKVQPAVDVIRKIRGAKESRP